MAAYVFVSAKGAPGVTTSAATLAAVAADGGKSLLVELDPAGGTVPVAAPGPVRHGLVEAAGELRRRPRRVEAVVDNTEPVPPGVDTLVAPTKAHAAESVIQSVGGRWLPVLDSAAPEVFVDGGRWSPLQGTASRVAGAGLVVAVCQPSVDGVEYTRHLVQPLRELARQQVVLLVVGHRPFEPAEVAEHIGTPLVGALAWDPAGAGLLWSQGCTGRWLRSRLARSAGPVLERLQAMAAARAKRRAASDGTAAGNRPAGGGQRPAGTALRTNGNGKQPPSGTASRSSALAIDGPAPPAGGVPALRWEGALG